MDSRKRFFLPSTFHVQSKRERMNQSTESSRQASQHDFIIHAAHSIKSYVKSYKQLENYIQKRLDETRITETLAETP